MAIIKCKMCGGDLKLQPDCTVAECEYCGSVQTVPAVDSEKKMSMFARAGKLRSECEFDKAAGIYESIVADFPVEAEAWWGLVLCKYGIEYVDDPATGKKIPTCHRSSFDSVLEDSSFLQVMEYADTVARKVYREEAKEIERLRRGILEVSSREEPYDIFICYKETDEHGSRTVDSVLAQDIYDALTDKGYRVFFSRITLEEKLGQEFEPYIFAALNSAKVMLAVGTCDDYYHAVWVKNEWSRFLQLKEAGQNKILIPCYKNIDPYDMPREFAHLQAQDMGKVGAMQDLLRGMEKIIPRKQTVVQNVVVQQAPAGDSKAAALLKRGNMALEDGDFCAADKFFEEVLNTDAECAAAYIGKALAEEKCGTLQELAESYVKGLGFYKPKTVTLKQDAEYVDEQAEKYQVAYYLDKKTIQSFYRFDPITYKAWTEIRRERRAKAKEAWLDNKLLNRASQFADSAQQAELKDAFASMMKQLDNAVAEAEAQDRAARTAAEKRYETLLAEADAKVLEQYKAAETKRETQYLRYEKLVRVSTARVELQTAIGILEHDMKGYRESEKLAALGKQRLKEILANEQAAKEAKDAAEAARKRKNTIVGVSVIALIVAAILVMTLVVIPAVHYSKAERYMAEGDTLQAMFQYGAAGTYKDAREKSLDLWAEWLTNSTVDAGDWHAAVILENGTANAAGDRDDGRCNVSGWSDLISISAGGHHTVGLKADGTAVAVGYGKNGSGETKVDNWKNLVAVAAGGSHTLGLKADGTVVATGWKDSGACDVSSWTEIVAIAAGPYSSYGLTANGRVVSCGERDYGVMSALADWSKMVSISASGHVVGICTDGTVLATGDNSSGQCEVADWSGMLAVSAGSDHTVGLRADGTVVAVGMNNYGQCDVSEWTDIVAVSAGIQYTVGLRADGKVLVAGCSEQDRTLFQSIDDRTDVRMPEYTARQQEAAACGQRMLEEQYAAAEALLKSGDYDGAIEAFGALGAYSDAEDRVVEAWKAKLDAQYAAAEAKAEAGEYREAILAFRALGEYDDAPQRVAELWDKFAVRTVIDAGGDHTVGIRADGTVMAVGSNQYNQCDVSGGTDIVEVAAGDCLTAALRSDGTVLAVSSYQYYGVAKDDISNWANIVSISAGNHHVVGLKADGTVVAAGLNEYGQCEVSDWKDIVAISAGGTHTVGLKADGTVVACGNLERGRCNVSDWTDIVAISAGAAHTVGLRSDGTVTAVGGVGDGECGVNDWTDIVAVSADYHTVGLRSDGTVVATGKNEYGQCDVSKWTDIVAISAGEYHTVGLRADGTVVAVGSNNNGQSNVSGWTDIRVAK